MRRSQQKLFDQLEQHRKATTYMFRPLFPLFPERPSVHPRGTLAHFADQIGRTPEALITQFEDAGLPGLTPSMRLLEEHKEKLLAYLRAKHSPAEVLYEEQVPNTLSLVVVQDITAEIVAHLAKEPRLLYQLAPRKFEELVARLLEQQGCDVTLTKATRDGGLRHSWTNQEWSRVIVVSCRVQTLRARKQGWGRGRSWSLWRY